MTVKKRIQPDEKVPLKLTASERNLVLEGLLCLDAEYEQIVRTARACDPVMMTLDELDDFAGYVAAEANHTQDKKLQKKLDVIFQKTRELFETYTDEESPRTLKIEDAQKAKLVSDQAVQLAEWAAQLLAAA